MAAISAKLVKELRDKTGAGMMDCKKALVAVDGDIQAAIDELRKTGIAKAAKKAGRSTKEGAAVILVKDNVAVMVEALCETDFVANSDKFKTEMSAIAEKVFAYDVDGDASAQVNEDQGDDIKELVARLGENIQIRRVVRWVSNGGQFAVYAHGKGSIGCLAEVEGDFPADQLKFLGMHISASAPLYIQSSDVPAEFIEREKAIAAEQNAGKPENILEKILMGVIKKRTAEICLVDQPWITDDKTTFTKAFPKATVKRFARFQVGEEV